MTVQPKSLSKTPSLLQFSDNLFYRFDGDNAQLGAHLHIADTDAVQSQRCTLQLWACPEPYQGGELTGVRVAQVPVVAMSPEAVVQQQASALYPAGQEDYAMVMALVSESSDGLPVINDYVNFNQRQRFLQPCMTGAVEITRNGQQLNVAIAGIENPRDTLNMSGSLSLELWAAAAPYSGGPVEGTWLAGINLGQLAGGQQWIDQQFALEPAAAPATAPHWVLMLREWTADGFVTRDFRVVPLRSAPVTDAVEEATAEEARVEEAPVVEAAVVAAAPVVAAAVVEAPVAKPAAKAKKSSGADGSQLSVNSASEEELAQVKGLNAKLARLIVAGRPYLHIDELVKVRGIGERMVNKLRTLLSI